MRSNKVKFKSGKHTLIGIKTYPKITPAPGVILFHGLTNNKDDCPLIKETDRALVKAGFITFLFDFFGSGESPGNMEDKTIDVLFQNSLDSIKYLLQDKKLTNLGLWGRSIGGTLTCLIPKHPKIKARVSASGGVFLEKTFKSKFKKIQSIHQQGKKVAGTGNFKGKYNFKPTWYQSLKNIDQKIINNLKTLDTFLVLGTTPDIKVPINNAYQIIDTVKKPKKLVIYENIDHDYKNVEKQTITETVDWFNQHLMN